MRYKSLYLIYWTLLSITIISSSALFLFVAAENASATVHLTAASSEQMSAEALDAVAAEAHIGLPEPSPLASPDIAMEYQDDANAEDKDESSFKDLLNITSSSRLNQGSQSNEVLSSGVFEKELSRKTSSPRKDTLRKETSASAKKIKSSLIKRNINIASNKNIFNENLVTICKKEKAPALINVVDKKKNNDHKVVDNSDHQNSEKVENVQNEQNYGKNDEDHDNMFNINVQSIKQVISEVPKNIGDSQNNVVNEPDYVTAYDHKDDAKTINNAMDEINVEKKTEEASQLLGDRSDNNQQNCNIEAKSLPDIITDIPAATVTDLPIDILESAQVKLDTFAIESLTENQQENENLTFLTENNQKTLQKDDQVDKINDSGGLSGLANASHLEKAKELQENKNETESHSTPTTTPSEGGIPLEDSAFPSTTTTSSGIVDLQDDRKLDQQQDQQENLTKNMNLTAEEIPIPVFSEWAQKQMEAAEKQALQQEQQSSVNNSAQRKNNTNNNGKVYLHKTHAKNYAAPDCGAKIIASNADAVNTGALLSSSPDEYMLNPCGKRNWFVVELCEAIQAQKIHMANFELFSSTPKNFSVSVSNRYPTRDWSNVGRFIAEDKRELQSFDLHPHLFGKFVRVDIYSHYAKEHFCPISLFHVYGTSEFEAFETEDRPNDDLDDFEDELSLEQAGRTKYLDNNLFKSASDAVLSIVKKAAEVLVKPSINKVSSINNSILCQTPSFSSFNCDFCNQTLVDRINHLLSCDYLNLHSLLKNSLLYNDLMNSRVCLQFFGLDTKATQLGFLEQTCSQNYIMNSSDLLDSKRSYHLNILPIDMVGALCHLIMAENTRTIQNVGFESNSEGTDDSSTAQSANLTIDKKVPESFQINATQERKLITPPPATATTTTASGQTQTKEEQIASTTEASTKSESEDQLPRPPTANGFESTAPTTTPAPLPNSNQNIPNGEPLENSDVNIFNLVPESNPSKDYSSTTTEATLASASSEELNYEYIPQTTPMPQTESSNNIINNNQNSPSFEDNGSWENLENLLSSTVATPSSPTTPPSAMNANQNPTNGINYQQKLSSNGPQSESIFIRLSNRIKALERNMSLSGQYLEELSRRYKKQVEDLTTVLSQQMQNVRTLEEQNRHHVEVAQAMEQRNEHFKQEIEELKLQIHACVLVLVFVGGLLLFFLIVAHIFYHIKYKEILKFFTPGQTVLLNEHKLWPSKKSSQSVETKSNSTKKQKRRKSFDTLTEQQKQKDSACKQSIGVKERRPSEEASIIIKDCTSQTCTPTAMTSISSKGGCDHVRQRKLSIFYSNDEQPILTTSSSSLTSCDPQNKRNRAKSSWPSFSHDKSPDNHNVTLIFDKGERPKDNYSQEQKINVQNLAKPPNSKNSKAKKKLSYQQQQLQQQTTNQLKRQESAPATCITATSTSEISSNDNPEVLLDEFDEKLLLDEEEMVNFIPTSDLAYNEFMPEGPSAYHTKDKTSPEDVENLFGDGPTSIENFKQNSKKKSRRLSSPAFFKATFGKSLKMKGKGATTPPHESTSWEWYRLSRKNSSEERIKILHSPTSAGLDSASLSEITFPTNSKENSFRILEEAILSSGEVKFEKPSNNNSGKQKQSNSINNSNGSTRMNISISNSIHNIKENRNNNGLKHLNGSSSSYLSPSLKSLTSWPLSSSSHHLEELEQLPCHEVEQIETKKISKGHNSPSCCSNHSNNTNISHKSNASISNQSCNGSCNNGSASSASSSSSSSTNSSTKKKILGLNKIFRKVF